MHVFTCLNESVLSRMWTDLLRFSMILLPLFGLMLNFERKYYFLWDLFYSMFTAHVKYCGITYKYSSILFLRQTSWQKSLKAFRTCWKRHRTLNVTDVQL